ncbi:MAG: hypothetical protein U1E51_02835 [Candidatus Binatia bacterium]|nr:hypothetical protein [Candidatus Binatia bacterium]
MTETQTKTRLPRQTDPAWKPMQAQLALVGRLSRGADKAADRAADLALQRDLARNELKRMIEATEEKDKESTEA